MKHSESKRDDGVELESQVILRLPEEPAKLLREAVREGANNLKDRLTVKLENDMRYGEVRFDHWLLHAKVVDLPTVIESLKTIDSKSFYKTADVCQLIICKDEPDLPTTDDESPNKNKKKDPNKVDKKYLWPHGITPPCKNIRKRRFRKTLKKKFVEAPEIEKEVKRLLRADNEAVKCSWDLVTDDQDDHKNIQSLQNELGMPETSGQHHDSKKKGKKGGADKDHHHHHHHHRHSSGGGGGGDSTQMPRDIDIFGEDLSSSDDDDQHNINVELDENSRLSADDSRLYDYDSSLHGAGGGAGGGGGGGGHNSNMSTQDEHKLVTTFNKHMFNSPKSNVSSVGGGMDQHLHHTPSRRVGDGLFYDADLQDSDNESDFMASQMSQETINLRVAKIRRELNDLRNQRTQKDQEIASIENQALRSRMQDTLDNIMSQILDRELELQDLQAD